MGYADGYYYGQGRIICDTSTFSVGDTIRVRSMTDSNKVWNKQVATVGTPLVFTVPCYDYYKICTVQDIAIRRRRPPLWPGHCANNPSS